MGKIWAEFGCGWAEGGLRLEGKWAVRDCWDGMGGGVRDRGRLERRGKLEATGRGGRGRKGLGWGTARIGDRISPWWGLGWAVGCEREGKI